MTVRKGALLTLVLIIASFGVYLRIQNLKFLEKKYLVDRDSYRYFRQTRLIVEDGELPDLEMARNFPEGVNLVERDTFFPKLLTVFYRVVHSIFPSVSLHHVLSLYAPITVGIALIFLFFLTYRLFGRFSAILSILLLAALPVFSQRTLAGYVDTDAIIILFLFTSLYFYLLSFRETFGVQECIFAGLAGGISGMLSLVWLGSGMVSIIFCTFQLLISWTRDYNKKDLYRFLCWLVPTLLLISSFGTSDWANLQAPFTILALYIPLATLCVVVSIFFLQGSLRFVNFLRRFRLSVGLAVSLLFLCAGVLVLTFYSQDFSWVEGLIQRLPYPYGKNGIMEFVGELQPTTLQNWWKMYGMIGVTTLVGFFLVVYGFTCQASLHSLIHASIGGVGLLMIALVDTIPQFDFFLNFVSIQSTLILIGNFCIFVSLVATARLCYQTNSSTLTNRSELHLILIVWFIVAWNLASAAMRFHLFLAPAAAILTCHFLSWLLQKIMPVFSRFWTHFLLGSIFLVWLMLMNTLDIISLGIEILTLGKVEILVPKRIQFLLTLLITALLFGPILQEMFSRKERSIPIVRVVGAISVILLTWLNLTGLYTLRSIERAVIWGVHQGSPYPDKVIRTACEWLKENVSQSAVIAADWEIGSTINEISRKTTIVDAEQHLPKILEMSQGFFCGTETTALKFLEKYRVTHLLLSSNDLGALGMHSTTLQLSPGTHVVTLRQSPEYTRETWHFTPLGESFISEFQLDEIDCQQNQCSIKSISVPLTLENQLAVATPPEILIQGRNRKHILKVKEIIIGEQSWYFPEGQLDASVWCVGNSNGGVYKNYQIIYLSEVAREWFLVKLFLGEHSSLFKLVYESGASDRSLVKVWEVQNK